MLDRQEEYSLAKHWREDGDGDAGISSSLAICVPLLRSPKAYRGYGLPIADVIRKAMSA
jgi:RNA polymerase sigma-32 factor